MMNSSHLLRTLLLLPLLVFVLISVYYISGFHVWPLSRDQWHMYAPYFERGFWQTMLSPMSSHRHIFPFFFFHLDMSLFRGLNHFLVACGAFFNGLVIYLLLKGLLKEADISIAEKTCLAVFVVTQLVWLLNIAQLGWGFMSTQYYMAILTFLLAIYSAQRYHDEKYQQPRWIIFCLVCGIISTFSFGMGILVWPALAYFCWLWRSEKNMLLPVSATFFACLLLFFLLPGGENVEQALLWSPTDTLRFTFQLAAGPIFYLLKSWHWLETGTLKTTASVIGVLASAGGTFMLLETVKNRPVLSVFRVLCHALILLGLGTAALISFTRTTNFLDVWVDRYQIWATLFWSGFLPLLYLKIKHLYPRCAKGLLVLLFFLPILALPSQLDMGSRLYEYKNRVREALLFYQTGIPDQSAAQDALHWNWEHKLPFFFSVLSQLRSQHKNIYYQSPAEYLGHPLIDVLKNNDPENFVFNFSRINIIHTENLLAADKYPSLENFPAVAQKSSGINAGYQITAQVPLELNWEYAISVNEQNIINGLGIHIRHSRLPRSARELARRNYNFFGVVRYDNSSIMRWYLIGEKTGYPKIWQSNSTNFSQANSR